MSDTGQRRLDKIMMFTDSNKNKPLLRPAISVAAVMLLWAGYTLLQTSFVIGHVSAAGSALLGFIPGLLGLAVLAAAGLSRRETFLVLRPLSRRGFWVLTAIFVLALAVILPVSVWQGWQWRGALLYAPASGIAQELFFRVVLLSTLQVGVNQRRYLALFLHAVLFGLWHIGPLFVGAPLWGVIAVMLVPFLSGIGWGWQVQQDGTVLWAMVQHTLIWVVGNQFVLAV